MNPASSISWRSCATLSACGAEVPASWVIFSSVTVPSTYGSIDTYASDAMADATAAADLFEPGPDRTPVAGAVVAYAVTDELRNCPLQPEGN